MYKEFAPVISGLDFAGRMKHRVQFLDNQQQSNKRKNAKSQDLQRHFHQIL